MKRTEGKILDFLRIVVTTLLFLGFIAGTASAFNFQGYTYDETKGGLNGTNASIEVYTFGGPQGPGPQLQTIYYNLSNESGYFNVSGITGDDQSFYKIVLRHFNETNNTIDYIGQSLPEFPYQQINQLTMGSPIDFYLRPGGTINISAVNLTGDATTFRYQIKDTKLGYPIASNFTSDVSNAEVYVPANRNYSIMIYPNQSFPVSYDLNNLTTYPDNYANISFNTSNLLRRVNGSVNLSDGWYNFTDLKIIAYLMEPGSMVFQGNPMPYNMSAWDCEGPGNCQSDIYDPANGTFNITLPGAKMTANILLFATAYNATGYYGAFRNISLDYSNTSIPNFNFTLKTLLGTEATIELNNASGGPGGPPGTTNVTTKKLSFQLKNESSGENITGFAHIEVKVNYSAYNGSTFNWMTDASQGDNGSFSIPVINADINKINIFTQDFAPLKTSKTAAQLTPVPVVINLTSFNPGSIQGGPPQNIKIRMLKSRPECDVPQPAPSCNLFNDDGGEKNMTGFNPFKVVIGGGKISMRMKLVSNNITVHYKNVDMLASGPPDAVFDPSANQTSQSGTLLEQAWRFGSMGPEIYDEVLIGIPLGSVNPNNVSVKLGKLYDNSWNETWNISVNNISQIPSDYSAFNTTWFNDTTGMQCTTSITSPCYLDITRRMVWLTIPHFSGVGPTVSGTAGNFTANLTNSTGIAERNVTMNFTMNDTANTTSWYNITFPSGFDASAAIVNISINGSADPSDWEKTNGTLFVNVSSGTALANLSETQYINISNITLPESIGNKTISVTTSNGLTVSLNYTVATYGVNLSVSGSATATGTINATVNKTYTLLLQNNGTATDTYNLTVNSTNASIAALNVTTNITLGSMQTQVLLLDVTNTTVGTAYVNVTAQSLSDSTKVGLINTTTTITAEPIRNVSLTVSPVSASASTRPNVNATYTLNLTNTGNMPDSYTLALDGELRPQ